MKNTIKMSGFALIAAIILSAALLLAGCVIEEPEPEPEDPGQQTSEDQTSTAEDFNIGNLTQMEGSVTAVSITPKSGKSNGAITIYYEGTGDTTYAKSTTLPTAVGTYAVTFDVAAATGWKAASGLSAGTLTIEALPVFNSISELQAWLEGKPANTAATAYDVELNVSALGGDVDTDGSLGAVLKANETKYVNLDLSNSTITSIEEKSFYECKSLIGIIIPNGVATIGKDAFTNSNLTSVSMPDTVTVIWENAFWGCNFVSITIPDNVISIGDSAFNACLSLTSITIPKNVANIGSGVFNNCSRLTEIIVDDNNSVYTGIDGILYTKEKTELLFCPRGKTGSVTIPEGVIIIRGSAFSTCEISSVIIPNSVTGILTYAFSECDRLTSVTIGSGVTSLGSTAFTNCDNLISVEFKCTLTDNNTSFGSAFFGDLRAKYFAAGGGIGVYTTTAPVTSYSNSVWTKTVSVFNDITALGTWLTSQDANTADTAYTVKLNVSDITNIVTTLKSATDKFVYLDLSGSTITTIPDNAFSEGSPIPTGCATLTGITIPDGVTSIGNSAFYNCANLASVIIPGSVTTIGQSAFTFCTGLTSVTIPDSVTTIGQAAFTGCSKLTSINIPNSVTSIAMGAFTGCAFTSIDIPNSIISIEQATFTGCPNLTSVTIPSSVTSIGQMAFLNNASLTSVTFQGTIPVANFGNGVTAAKLEENMTNGLRDEFYRTNTTAGTPGTYTRTAGTDVWEKQ